eukprot:jgi/Galph1/1434/GphlegSOOS_G113.1
MTNKLDEFSQLFSKDTQSIFFNYKATTGTTVPSLQFAAIVNPQSKSGGFQKTFFGKVEIAIPIYGTIEEASKNNPQADVFINYASFRSAFESSMIALEQPTIRTVYQKKDTKALIARAKSLEKIIIGPATVGGIQAGSVQDWRHSRYDRRIYLSVQIISTWFCWLCLQIRWFIQMRMYNVLARTTDGIFEGIAIGGDTISGIYIGRSCIEFLLGELMMKSCCSAVEERAGKETSDLLGFQELAQLVFHSSEVQFGHAGAKSGGNDVSAEAKNSVLRLAGAQCSQFIEVFRIPSVMIVEMNLLYWGFPISDIIEKQFGNLSLLWFKKKLPSWASKFIEMCLIVAADHGPCVSGAHNTIVTARAGKDLCVMFMLRIANDRTTFWWCY